MLRSRFAWLGLVALTLGVAAPAQVRAVEPKLLPNDTEWIVTINVKQILGSELVKANREALDQLLQLARNALPADDGAEKFLKAAGFDLDKDLTSISAAGPASNNVDSLLVIVEGKFNEKKLHAAGDDAARANADVVKISNAGGVRVYEISVPGEKTIYASLIGGSTLLASAAKETLTDAIARNAGTKKSTLKKEFKALIDTTNAKQSLNFVATGNALAKGIENAPRIPNPDQIAAALGQIDGLAGSLTLAKDVQFQLAVSAKDAETAQQMAQGIQIGLGALKAMIQKKAAGDDPKAQIAADIVKTLKVSAMGSNVIFRGELTLDVIEKIFKNLPG